MSNPQSVSLAQGAAIAAAQRWLRSAGIAVAGSVFIAICAHISLPLFFTPVPLTLQPFAVLLIGLLLSPQLAVATVVAYLAEGALGLPVFTPSPLSGVAHLIGPTGGYLLAYIVAAPFTASLYRRSNRGFYSALLWSGLGSLIILGGGAVWFAIYSHTSAQFVLVQSVVPFLPGDVLKVAAAAGIAAGYNRLRRSR